MGSCAVDFSRVFSAQSDFQSAKMFAIFMVLLLAGVQGKSIHNENEVESLHPNDELTELYAKPNKDKIIGRTNTEDNGLERHRYNDEPIADDKTSNQDQVNEMPNPIENELEMTHLNNELIEGDIKPNRESLNDMSSSDEEDLLEGQDHNDELIEGDMKLSQEQLHMLLDENAAGQGRSGQVDTRYRWPEGIVKFEFHNSVSYHNQEQIRDALENLQSKLDYCIRFEESHYGKRIKVTNIKNTCESWVGYQYDWNYQRLNLASGCMYTATIEHEFLHAIGLHHHQNRHDRDQYVEILSQNIEPEKMHNFQKYSSRQVTHYGLPYDYESVMHYGSYDFSKNGMRTIRTKDSSKQGVIGNAKGISDLDIELVKKMYNCGGGPVACDYTDYFEDCGYWAGLGDCQDGIWRDWMNTYCQRSCWC